MIPNPNLFNGGNLLLMLCSQLFHSFFNYLERSCTCDRGNVTKGMLLGATKWLCTGAAVNLCDHLEIRDGERNRK